MELWIYIYYNETNLQLLQPYRKYFVFLIDFNF